MMLINTLNKLSNFEVRIWINFTQSGNKIPQNSFQLLFFLGSDFTPEQAFEKMKLMFDIKCNLPEAFSNRDPYSKEITSVYENINILYMPIAPSGHSVIHLSLRNYNVRSFNFEAATKAFFMTLGKFIDL